MLAVNVPRSLCSCQSWCWALVLDVGDHILEASEDPGLTVGVNLIEDAQEGRDGDDGAKIALTRMCQIGVVRRRYL